MLRYRWWLLGAVSLALLIGISLLESAQERHRPRTNWTPQQLQEALAAAGLRYESHPLPYDGLVLKMPGDPATWEELVEDTARPAAIFGRRPGRLHLLRDNTSGHGGAVLSDPNHIQAGRLLIRGHRDDLKRVAALLAP